MRSQGLLVVVVSLFALAGAWFALRSGGDAVAGAPPGQATGSVDRAAAVPVAPAGADAGHADAGVLATDGAAARTVVQPTAATAGDVVCTVSGRIVDRAGAPRQGLEVDWTSWRAVGELGGFPLADRGDVSANTARDKVRTDRDGRFSFAMAKGRGGRLGLDVDHFVFQRGDASFSTEKGDAVLGDLVVVLPARLRGSVVDGRGSPVADVKVSVQAGQGFGFGSRSEDKTDAQGQFELGALHAGSWTVRTLSARYQPSVLLVTLADEEQKADLKIVVDQGRSIAGQVVDDRGVPIAGMQVGAMRTERTGGMSIERFTPDEATTTDEGGFFLLGGLTADAVTVRASGKGHATATESNVAVGTGNLLLRLARHASVAGRLLDMAGAPIAGSRVAAAKARGGTDPVADHIHSVVDLDTDMVLGGPQATTAADGTFRIDDVAPGTITVRARGKTHRPAESVSFVVQPAQVMEGIVVKVDLGAAVAVTVVDADGEPVADAKVEVREPPPMPGGNGAVVNRHVIRGGDDGDRDEVSFGDGPRRLGRGTTDRQGLAQIAGLPTGTAIVAGSHEQFADAQPMSVVLPAHGSVDVRLVLRQPGAAKLQVTMPDGNGVAASYVVHGPLAHRASAALEEERDRDGKTDDAGAARVAQLPAGDYWAELRLQAKPREFGSAMIVFDGDQRPVAGTRVLFRVEAGRDTEVALRMPILTRVHGIVNGADGPASNVSVELAKEGDGEADVPGMGGPNARTGADGSYELTDVMPGRYRLRWGKSTQIVKASAIVDIAANQPDLRRDLDLRYGALRLQVVGKDDGEPVEGAEIELVEAGSEGAPPRRERRMMMVSMSMTSDGGESTSMTVGGARATTDVDGIAEIADVPPGRYTVRVRHDRFAARELADQSVLERATTDCGRVELDTAGKIRGRVVGPDGKPVGMALVTCRKVGSTAEPDRQPALSGAFTFAGLAAGRYAVQAQRVGAGDDAKGEPIEVEVAAGKTAAGVEVRLPGN